MFLKRLFISVLIVSSFNIFAAQREYQPKKSFIQTTKARVAADKKRQAKVARIASRCRHLSQIQFLGALMAVSMSGAYAADAMQQISSQPLMHSRHQGMITSAATKQYRAEDIPADCATAVSNASLPEKNVQYLLSFNRQDWHVCHDQEPGFKLCCKTVYAPELDNTKIDCCRFDFNNQRSVCGSIDLSKDLLLSQAKKTIVIEDWRSDTASKNVAKEVFIATEKNTVTLFQNRDEFLKSPDLQKLETYSNTLPSLVKQLQKLKNNYDLQGDIYLVFIGFKTQMGYRANPDFPSFNTIKEIRNELSQDRLSNQLHDTDYVLYLPLPWLLKTHDNQVIAHLAHELGHGKQSDLGYLEKYDRAWFKQKLMSSIGVEETTLHNEFSADQLRYLAIAGLAMNYETNADFLAALAIQSPSELARQHYYLDRYDWDLIRNSDFSKKLKQLIEFNPKQCLTRYASRLVGYMRGVYSLYPPTLECRIPMLLILNQKYLELVRELKLNLLKATVRDQ